MPSDHNIYGTSAYEMGGTRGVRLYAIFVCAPQNDNLYFNHTSFIQNT